MRFKRPELEVLQRLRDGLSPADIALDLDISLSTVRNRITRIRTRAGLSRGAYPILNFALQRQWMPTEKTLTAS